MLFCSLDHKIWQDQDHGIIEIARIKTTWSWVFYDPQNLDRKIMKKFLILWSRIKKMNLKLWSINKNHNVLRILRFANLKIRRFARFGRISNPNLKSTGIESESQLRILKFQPSPESRISNPNLDICKYRIRISKPNLKMLPESES